MIDTTKQNFIIYSTDESNVNIQILADSKNETIWLNQKQIAEIFDTTKQNISNHISNILKDEELTNSSVKDFLTVRNDGTSIGIKHYNLDMIIAVGYRVNSKKATKFRIWATKTLKEFIIKGFILDDERLKQGNNVFNKNYLDELLERIREIRASERLFYEKVKELFSLSIDYDKNSDQAKEFFTQIQMKLEFAIIHKTPAEIISTRIDHKKPNCGLTSWSGQKSGKEPIKTDINTAKNYLLENELRDLNMLTTMLLDYAENQIKKGIVFTMSDWNIKLDSFLEFNGYDVLKGFGKVTTKQAKIKATSEYSKFKELKQKSYINELKKIKDTQNER